MVNCIKKRDGRLAQFDINKIADAISKAFEASTGKKEYSLCLDLAKQTVKEFDTSETVEPNVEQIQDAVEKVLIKN